MLDYIFLIKTNLSESKRLQTEKRLRLPGYLQTPSYAIAECRMVACFKTTWKIRTLQPLFPHNLFCKFGAEIDRLGYHFYVCPEKAISSKVRYKMHTALKDVVIETGDAYFSLRNVRANRREPQMKDYFNPLPPPSTSRTPTQSQQSEAEDNNPFHNPMGPNRRADIAFLPYLHS